ncbi:S-adenosyl-L-methionine-dependent methyltransferase [Polyplosphaeria fusca]|uniref:S-adenosyl-L-methionine-dependent methyltransferase n=1 Tax=Polyplosphaeria fusca TaxID=682080 RepID=A0A9P4QYZ7_9PLEO|nr:S-adenosyl-L-methionine-dependent methyltransferase [Polyplosphaeria fusca]
MSSGLQAQAAIQLYEGRSADYDNTWHVSFAERFASHVNFSQGQHVLDLACGTGLLTYIEADAVGPTGRVVGVDVTPGMLQRAMAKKQRESARFAHVEFHEGDILSLNTIEPLQGQKFDVITVASALVLFPDPVAAIRHWAGYLNPGGIVAMDSTHPKNLVAGIVLERTAKRLGMEMPYHREWSKSEQSLRDVMTAAGLDVVQVVTIENQSGYGKREYDVSDGIMQFISNVITGMAQTIFADSEVRRKAKDIFEEEWEKLAEHGKIEEVDSVFLGIAQEASQILSEDVVFSGGCRCGGVRYRSSAQPSPITFCHCRACQQVSGSGSLPFIEIPTESLRMTSTITLKSLWLSEKAERTFCGSCGAPITMKYISDGKVTECYVTMGSVDTEKFKGEFPKIEQHIYVKEKALWEVLPDDGAPRYEVTREDDMRAQSA